MDTDLFQILALILLLGLLLTLFGVLQSLGAIRRTLEGRGASDIGATGAAAESSEATPRADEEPSTWARPTESAEPASGLGVGEAAPAASRTGWPAPQEAAADASAPAAEAPAAEAPAASATSTAGDGGRALYGDSGLATATPSESSLRTDDATETASDAAAAASTGASGTNAAAGATAQTQSAAEDPQEQPFERDGRWWFRRGDELLVYEEQTGQWVAAEEPSSAGSVATASEPAAAASEPASAEGQVTTQQAPVAGSFWKCPSCGAVNGSTATSCRMCFTARP